MKRQFLIAATLLLALPATALAQRPPAQALWDKATADVTSADPARQTAAVEQLKTWLRGGWVSDNLWRFWIPGLLKTGRHQDIVDLATLGIHNRPWPVAIIPLLDARTKAYLALNDGKKALMSAKSYYNACDMQATAAAIDLLGLTLAKARPEDLEIVRKFRNEQALASRGTPPVPPAKSILSEVENSPEFDAPIALFVGKTARFTDRFAYGHLLLMAGKGEDAEKHFRELYQVAANQEELTQATEGIAKALRAQDGHVARANAWLIEIQKQNAANPITPTPPTITTPVPGTTPPTRGTPPARGTTPPTTRGPTTTPTRGDRP